MQFCVCVVVLFCTLSRFTEAEQPYTVKNEGSEHFNGMRETIFHFGQIKIIGRERLINGSFTITEPMASDHFKFQFELFSSPQGDDQYKRLPMGIPRTTICEAFKAYFKQVLQPSFIEGENTNFPSGPDEGLCPIPAGEFYIKNLLFDTDTWPNQLPRGLLKGQITFFKDEINVGGGALFVRVEDRE